MDTLRAEGDKADLMVLVSAEVKRQITALSRDTWGTAGEAAFWARVSKAHLLRLCRQGQGPEYVGSGKLMRFKRSAVDRWLAGKCRRQSRSGNANSTNPMHLQK